MPAAMPSVEIPVMASLGDTAVVPRHGTNATWNRLRTGVGCHNGPRRRAASPPPPPTQMRDTYRGRRRALLRRPRRRRRQRSSRPAAAVAISAVPCRRARPTAYSGNGREWKRANEAHSGEHRVEGAARKRTARKRAARKRTARKRAARKRKLRSALAFLLYGLLEEKTSPKLPQLRSFCWVRFPFRRTLHAQKHHNPNLARP